MGEKRALGVQAGAEQEQWREIMMHIGLPAGRAGAAGTATYGKSLGGINVGAPAGSDATIQYIIAR